MIFCHEYCVYCWLPLPFLPKIAEAFFSNGGEKHNVSKPTDLGTFLGICPSWKKKALDFCPRN